MGTVKGVTNILLINQTDIENIVTNVQYTSPWNNGAGGKFAHDLDFVITGTPNT